MMTKNNHLQICFIHYFFTIYVAYYQYHVIYFILCLYQIKNIEFYLLYRRYFQSDFTFQIASFIFFYLIIVMFKVVVIFTQNCFYFMKFIELTVTIKRL